LFAYYAHSTATTTERGLDDDGEAKFIGKGLDVLELLDGARGSWDDWNIAFDGQLSRRDLVTERINGVRRRSYKLLPRVSGSASGLALSKKINVFDLSAIGKPQFSAR
jgi:hypothetical protein